MSAIDTRWFQGRLADKRISQRALAKRLGMDPAAVSLTLHGRRKLTAAEAAGLAQALGVGIAEVMERAGLAARPRGSAGTGAGACAGDGCGKDGPMDQARCGRVIEGGGIEGGGIEEVLLEVTVPLAKGGVVRLRLPRDLSQEDAERLAAMIRAFAVTGKE